MQYLHWAWQTSEQGWWAIVTYDRSALSVMFVQVLAVFVKLFGSVATVGLLLNLFCYTGMMVILTRWASREPKALVPAAITIVAISFSPALVLWSVQPLKDTLFQFLVLAFFGACAAWQRWWVIPTSRRTPILAGAAMFASVFAIASMRWYFAFALLIVGSLFLLGIALRATGRKSVAFATAAVTAVLLSRAFLWGAGPYVPPTIAAVIEPARPMEALRTLPADLVANIEHARANMDSVPGNSAIRTGAAIATVHPKAAPPSARTVVHETNQAAAILPSPPPVAVAAVPQAPPTARVAAPVPPAIAPQAAATARPKPTPVQLPATAVLPPRLASIQTPAAPVKALTHAKTTDAAVAEAATDLSTQSTSRVGRMLTGVAAIVIPRSLGERLGFFHIGGGRGTLWFTEVDTIVFDLILVYCLFLIISRAATALGNPLICTIVLATIMIGVPLVYSVANFGTLFRLREMIYLGMALTPIALATTARATAPTPAEELGPEVT
jgi:hypothetical protein